jgi:hypothetical protein
MCHERYRRQDERTEEVRGERLWDLFRRETQTPAPTVPVVEREPDREEALSGAAPRRNDLH